MVRLGITKKKKSPRSTDELSQLKEDLRRVSEQLQSRERELAESLEQQTATNEILGVIASSPTDIQPVLNTVATNAARLCEAADAQIRLVEGERTRLVASFGALPAPELRPTSLGSPTGRAILNRETIHIQDTSTPEAQAEFAESSAFLESVGVRTALATPLLREGVGIGAILIRRTEVRPFSDKQIKLLETFAHQAVIAIENVRLFQELKQRTAELETSNAQLTEALAQQTATGEVLGVIASSPTELQPVLDVIAESAARLCDGSSAFIQRVDGNVMKRVAAYPYPAEFVGEEVVIDRKRISGRAIIDRQTIHVHDVAVEVQSEFPGGRNIQPVTGTRSALATPLLRERVAIGVIFVRRTEVRPFSEKQIALLKIFADQAVIAIENVRLFKELEERNRDLTEALEQQTATSEILGVIASSPTDIQPVLDTVIANAVRLIGATQGHIRQYDGEFLRPVAHYGERSEQIASLPIQRPIPESFSGRAFLEKRAIHILDVEAEPGDHLPARQHGARTLLNVPLLREGTPTGTITIWRDFVEPFTERQIELVKTFADQAVIAIENVRLFKEIQERNAELREALEHQTATSEVLGIISRSPTDVQPVLDAIVESAARVCGIDDVLLRLREGSTMVMRAHFGPILIPMSRVEISIDEPWYHWMREHGALHVPDVRAAQNDFPTMGSGGDWRTILFVPLRQQGELIGTLIARRTEVRLFTPAQIKLLETFADQAVIAIENVRLFNELKESLEQQTATSEILGVIASSPTEIQPVFDEILVNAARLCDAKAGTLFLHDDDTFRAVALCGATPAWAEFVRNPIRPGPDTGLARLVRERKPIHIADILAEPIDRESQPNRVAAIEGGARTGLHVPMLKEQSLIGAINIYRHEVRPFTDNQIKLLETFASQAVIAIENVRLFKELQERNAELREALEHQTATS